MSSISDVTGQEESDESLVSDFTAISKKMGHRHHFFYSD